MRPCHRNPCRCRPPPRPPVKWGPPPLWWLMQRGFVLRPRGVGWPAEAQIRFTPSPMHPHMPRLPWPYETESRPPGTGLVMGQIPPREMKYQIPPRPRKW